MNGELVKNEEETKNEGEEENSEDNKDTEQYEQAEDEEDKEEEKEKEKDEENKKYNKKCWFLDTKGTCGKKDKCMYSHEICQHFKRTGYCKYMNDCKYVHSPIKNNTKELCRYQNNCTRGNECRYAHTKEDSRKTIPCKFEKERRCNKGERCEFKHIRGGRTNPQYMYPQRHQTYTRYESAHPQRQNFHMGQRENLPRQIFQNLQHDNGLRKQETDMLLESLLRTVLRN